MHRGARLQRNSSSIDMFDAGFFTLCAGKDVVGEPGRRRPHRFENFNSAIGKQQVMPLYWPSFSPEDHPKLPIGIVLVSSRADRLASARHRENREL